MIEMKWFDDSGDSLESKLKRAAERYEQKYGSRPAECKVHPSMVEGERTIHGIKVQPARDILPNTFLLLGDES